MTEDQSTQIQIHLPPISDDRISNDLVDLTEALAKAGADISGGFLGGEYGYGAYFENDTFMMHPYCWCGRSDCAWCVSCECGDDADQYFVRGTNEYLEVGFEAWLKAYDPDDHDARKSHRVTENLCDLCSGRVEPAPNFLHKSSGSKVRWYKYIGRGMEVDLKADWRTIFAECVESVGS